MDGLTRKKKEKFRSSSTGRKQKAQIYREEAKGGRYLVDEETTKREVRMVKNCLFGDITEENGLCFANIYIGMQKKR